MWSVTRTCIMSLRSTRTDSGESSSSSRGTPSGSWATRASVMSPERIVSSISPSPGRMCSAVVAVSPSTGATGLSGRSSSIEFAERSQRHQFHLLWCLHHPEMAEGAQLLQAEPCQDRQDLLGELLQRPRRQHWFVASVEAKGNAPEWATIGKAHPEHFLDKRPEAENPVLAPATDPDLQRADRP